MQTASVPLVPTPDLFAVEGHRPVGVGELVGALAGGASIRLEGFAPEDAAAPHWAAPLAPFVASADPAQAQALKHQRSRRLGWLLAVLCSLLVGLTAGLAGHVAAFAQLDSGAVQWQIKGVDEAGVLVNIGPPGVDARPERIQVGGRLPNGDLVVSVSPAQRLVLLGSGALHLRPPTNKQEPGRP